MRVVHAESLILQVAWNERQHTGNHHEDDHHGEEDRLSRKPELGKRKRRHGGQKQHPCCAQYADKDGIEHPAVGDAPGSADVCNVKRKRGVPARIAVTVPRFKGVPDGKGQRIDHQKQKQYNDRIQRDLTDNSLALSIHRQSLSSIPPLDPLMSL